MTSHRAPRSGRGSGVAAALGGAFLAAAAALWLAGAGVDADAVPMAPAAGPPAPALVAPAAPEAQSGGGAGFSVPAPPVAGAPPVELRLPGRTVRVDPVGVAPDGSVGVPDDPSRAGWWVAGAAPADATGSTVLVGHLDSETRGLGAFAALLDLPADSRLSVVDTAGGVHRYRVVSREQRAKADLPTAVFARDGSPRLVLVTCGGAFDRATHHYDDNVIVAAVPDNG
jgi:hypothetical protein